MRFRSISFSIVKSTHSQRQLKCNPTVMVKIHIRYTYICVSEINNSTVKRDEQIIIHDTKRDFHLHRTDQSKHVYTISHPPDII